MNKIKNNDLKNKVLVDGNKDCLLDMSLFGDRNIKACVFDLDGTLFDSLDVWARIDVAFLSKRGFDVPEEYMEMVSACGFVEASILTIDYFNLNETPEDLMNEWNEMAVEEYTHNVGLKNGAKEFLQMLKQCGYRLCVATSLPKHLNEPVLKNNGIYDMFEFIATVDGVGKGKNNPDIWNFVADKLGLNPSECVVFEDILPAIKSAKKVGFNTCGVYDVHSLKLAEQIKSSADWFMQSYNKSEIDKLK